MLSAHSNIRLWKYGGALALLGSSSIMVTSGAMTAWNPMPVYLVIAAWLFSLGYVFVLPVLYLTEFTLIGRSFHFGKMLIVIITMASGLNILYFVSVWGYGIQWQGTNHTIIVALENAIGFSVALCAAFWGHYHKSLSAQYAANLLLFLLLSWCAFPYLGELP